MSECGEVRIGTRLGAPGLLIACSCGWLQIVADYVELEFVVELARAHRAVVELARAGELPASRVELLADRLTRGDVLTPEELGGPEYAAACRELRLRELRGE